MSKKKMKQNASLIYCGPSILGELQQFSIFKSDFPMNIEDHIQKCPEIKKMFFPASELARVKKRIKEQGTMENQIYNKILKYQKEG